MPNDCAITCNHSAQITHPDQSADNSCTPFPAHPTTQPDRYPTVLFIILKLIHLISIVIWVGGMFFAHFFLRPAVQELEAPARVKLMRDVLGRFFSVVLILVVLVLASGVGLIGAVHGMAAKAGAQFTMPLSWIVMSVLGIVMMAVFGHIRFALYKRLNNAVEAKDWAAGGAALGSIRKWVAFNLALGLVIIAAMRFPLG